MSSARAAAMALSLRWVALLPRHASFSRRATIKKVTRADHHLQRVDPAVGEVEERPGDDPEHDEAQRHEEERRPGDDVGRPVGGPVEPGRLLADVGGSGGMVVGHERRWYPTRPGGHHTRAATSPTAWTTSSTRMPPPSTV